MNVIPFTSLEAFPRDGEILIYGAGGQGRYLARLMREYRKDLRIIGFMDTYKSGSEGDCEIFNLSRLGEMKARHPRALVVVASIYAYQIYCALLGSVLEEIYVPDPFLVYGHRHSPECGLEKLIAEMPGISAMFRRKKDRDFMASVPEFFTFIPDCGPPHRRIMEHHQELDEQYFDFINKKKIRYAIDGGMENGSTALRFLHHLPGVRVHGFEPLAAGMLISPLYPFLAGRDDVVINYKALSDSSGAAVMKIFSENTGTGYIAEGHVSKYSLDVETVSIDDYLATAGIPRIDYIKLDIESFEINALRGARQTIARDRPQLAVCLYHRMEHYYEVPKTVFSLCEDYNYYIGFYGIYTFLETVMYCIPKEIDENE